MAKLPDPAKLLEALRTIKPVASPCLPEVRAWWKTTALPLLRDQALSELHRNDEMPPRLLGFMNKDGSDMAVVNISDATGGEWGTARSKDATAFIHKIAAMVPGTYASVFCSEAWALKASKSGELEREHEKYPNLGDHPDRYEVVMFQMLHYERASNQMMQLSTIIEVLKVLGKRSRMSWQHTKLADEVVITDPLDTSTGGGMSGRFIFGDPESPT